MLPLSFDDEEDDKDAKKKKKAKKKSNNKIKNELESGHRILRMVIA